MNGRLIGCLCLLMGACDEAPTGHLEPDGGVDSTAADAEVSGDGPGLDARPDAAADAARPPPPPLIINEVSCRGDEWVELYNPNEVPVSLFGWSLSDAEPEDAFPLSGVIPALGYQVVREAGDAGDGFTFHLDCDDDTVRLFATDGQREAVALRRLGAAHTLGRLPDGAASLVATAPTPGRANQAPAVPGGDLFDPLHVVEIDLALTPASVADLEREPRAYTATRIRIGAMAEDEALEGEVRLKGGSGSFRRWGFKPALKVQLATPYRGLRELTLGNMVQDPSYVHEWLAAEILRRVGLPTPRVGYAWVTANGQTLGLYSNIESPDRSFLDRHFASTAHLYEGHYDTDLVESAGPGFDVDVGDDDRSDLWRVVAALDAAPAPLLPPTEALIDWPQVVRAMAVELYVGQRDGYVARRNNYLLHFAVDGRMSLLPAGLDQAFSFRFSLTDGVGRLFRQCLADAGCRDEHLRALVDVAAAVDATPDLDAMVEQVAAGLRPWAAREVASGLDQRAVDEARLFLRLRRTDLGEWLRCRLDPPPDEDGDGEVCDRDCDPRDPETHVGAEDRCGDRLDQDCNGVPDDGPACGSDCVSVERGAHRRWVCPTPRTYDDAVQACAAVGSALVMVNTAEEDARITRQIQAVAPGDFWLGLTDRQQEGHFIGPDRAVPPYTRWAAGAPDGGADEDCVRLRADGQGWDNVACDARLGAVCEDACPGEDDGDGDGFSSCKDDCRPGDPTGHPGAVERCFNEEDDDCDGRVDEGEACECHSRDLNGTRYQVCVHPRTWADARAFCRERGGDLLVVAGLRDDPLDVLLRELPLAPLWIGLTDEAREGEFVWVDGTPLRFGRWRFKEPNESRGGEDCVEVTQPWGDWNDRACDHLRRFVCQQPAP